MSIYIVVATLNVQENPNGESFNLGVFVEDMEGAIQMASVNVLKYLDVSIEHWVNGVQQDQDIPFGGVHGIDT